MNSKNFHIQIFGCQMNVNDSDWLVRALTELGYKESSFEDARIHILMTCSVRDKPEHKVYCEIGQIKLLAQKYPERDIFACVGGCVAQQAGLSLFPKLNELKLVFGTDGVAEAPAAIAKLAESHSARYSPRITLLDFSDDIVEKEHKREIGEQSPYAFINIMQGCNNFCSYCIVPFVRGRQKSRLTIPILDEARQALDLGARELTLLGQNVNSFGQDSKGDGTSFTELLYKVAELPKLARLRFVTSHPKDMAPDLIQAFKDIPKLAPCLHLPLQSGSDKILKSMGRKYDSSRYLSLIESLRKACPSIEITTDIITGFPGETDEDFAETMRIMREADFLSTFSFIYSDRPGTKASSFENKVDRKVALERLVELQAWQNDNMDRKLNERVGGFAEVIIDRLSTENEKLHGEDQELVTWHGRDEYSMSVNIVTSIQREVKIGELLRVNVTGPGRHALKASLI